MSTETSKFKLSYKEYCLFPNDGNRHEVIDGQHYVNPAPTPNHQSVSKYLLHYFFTKVDLAGHGKVFAAPIDIQLGEFNIVQPDLIVLLNDTKAKITKTRVIGPPDVVINSIWSD